MEDVTSLVVDYMAGAVLQSHQAGSFGGCDLDRQWTQIGYEEAVAAIDC